MTETEASPFVPGARVAVNFGWGEGEWREDFVDKVYKSGRFTLRSDHKQQWRPSHGGWGEGRYHAAFRTGDHYDRATLRLWDEAADKEISEQMARTRRRRRLERLQEQFRRKRVGEVTDAILDQIEAALAAATETVE